MDVAAAFAAVFVALYVGHQLGDYWIQTSTQAAVKGECSRAGRLACTGHVVSLTATKGVVLALVVLVLDIPVTAAGLVLGLGLDAVSHWWADRRTTLARLAQIAGKGEFYSLGTGAHPKASVTANGEPAVHLGTGAHALDQSWHTAFLFLAALAIAAI